MSKEFIFLVEGGGGSISSFTVAVFVCNNSTNQICNISKAVNCVVQARFA